MMNRMGESCFWAAYIQRIGYHPVRTKAKITIYVVETQGTVLCVLENPILSGNLV